MVFHHAVYDGFAVLGFTYLEIRGFATSLDKITGSVDIKQSGLFTFNLPAQQNGRIKIDVVVF